jgi:hypothetical protein
MSARVAVWCTPEMGAKLMEMKVAAQNFQTGVWMLRTAREHDSGPDAMDAWKKVEDQRRVVKAHVPQMNNGWVGAVVG